MKYYYLKEDAIIQEGDEVDLSDGFNDPPDWKITTMAGMTAPAPQYPAHRRYRRKVDGQPEVENEET